MKINGMNQLIFGVLLLCNLAFTDVYPDQHYTLRIEDISARIETNNGLVLSSDGSSMELEAGATQGYLILLPDSSEQPFNRGLPSWNGNVYDDDTSFLIQMRFPHGSGWSDWLTVGYWKDFIWSSYGKTSFAEGYVDIDYVKLSKYANCWQFRINMLRENTQAPSPSIHKLSFFVSDTRTTNAIDYNAILNDKPQQIFVETDFIYQYGVDDDIGGSICSPSSVSMILRSYDIKVDPYEFSVDTYDTYYNLFGVWPRVVQNAAEKGLDGAVTRYRTWSEARDVLANGGRIAMSVGPPLYGGHLLMLAGFTSDGKPIVHDPAKSNGYGYVYNKSDLSHSWFDKGGIAYTFYPADSQATAIEEGVIASNRPAHFQLYQNYPNPFNNSTRITFELTQNAPVNLSVYDAMGRLVDVLYDEYSTAGYHEVNWDAAAQASGTYFISLTTDKSRQVIKTILMR